MAVCAGDVSTIFTDSVKTVKCSLHKCFKSTMKFCIGLIRSLQAIVGLILSKNDRYSKWQLKLGL